MAGINHSVKKVVHGFIDWRHHWWHEVTSWRRHHCVQFL